MEILESLGPLVGIVQFKLQVENLLPY